MQKNDQKKLVLTDLKLVENYQQDNNNKWVGELYSRYAHLVFGVCFKYLQNKFDAEDATNQIFEKLLELLKKHEVKNVYSWLYSVAKNHCLQHLRRHDPFADEKGKMSAEDASAQGFLNDSAAQEARLSKELLEGKIEKLETALAELKTEQKECIQLFYLEKTGYRAIAERLNIDLKTVKTNIQNGKRNLKLILAKHHEFKQ